MFSLVSQIRGSIQDGINSVTRYYLNNFCDGSNQDALDLFHGRYVPDRAKASPLATPSTTRASVISLFTRVSIVLASLFGLWGAFGAPEWTPSTLGLVSLFLLCDVCVTVYSIFSRGRKFVNKPRLVPEAEPEIASKSKPE
jgi:hypothetical protein